jgi:16S rRNA (guanine966-N2)-methyltransferase
MRVITGLYKGRVLRTVKDLSVRPATGRVRQTIFDMLTHRIDLEESRVLDLFAGSGSLGIECLSRGAAHVTFVEYDEEAVRYLEQNIRTLGCEDRTEILPMDSMAFLRGHPDAYEIIFADPPYAFGETPSIPDRVFEGGFLAPSGYLLIEHSTEIGFADGRLFRVTDEKRFGRTMVTFLRHHQADRRTNTT